MDGQESRVASAEDDPTWRKAFPTLTAYLYVDHCLAVVKPKKMPPVWNTMMSGAMKKKHFI